MEGETAALEQRDIIAIGGGVVEDATPLRHNLITDWKGGNLLQLAKSGVTAEGGRQAREGPLDLFEQVRLGRVLNEAVDLKGAYSRRDKKANPPSGPHLLKSRGARREFRGRAVILPERAN